MRAFVSGLCRVLGVPLFVVGTLATYGATVGKDLWVEQLWKHGVRSFWILEPDPRLAICVLSAGVLLSIIGNLAYRKPLEESVSHGSARFATTEELRKFGYSEAAVDWWTRFKIGLALATYPHVNGVVLGQEDTAVLQMSLGKSGSPALKVKKSAPLVVVREHHVAIEGPPGSGKDVSIAIPALWYDVGRSVVVLDPKGNQYKRTARARGVHSVVRCFAPIDPDSDQFNLLCRIPVGTPYEISEVDQLSNALLSVAKDDKDPSTFYSTAAQPLLTAAIIYVLHNKKAAAKTLPAAFDIINAPGEPKDIALRICAGLPKHASVLKDQLETLANDKRIIQSMFTTCTTKLNFCSLPTVRAAISGSDFVPSDLFDRDVPCSLYLVTPFKYADTLRPLMKAVLNILIGSHSEKRNFDTCYYLNEFPSLGPVPAIPRAAAEIREYGVQFAFFWQSEGQILATYGKEAGQAILDVCRARVMLGVTGRLAAENATAMIGKGTVVRERETTAVSKKNIFETTHTKTHGVGEQAREKMTPDEVRTIGPDKLLIWLPYLHAYVAKRCVSYSQPRFRKALSLSMENINVR